MILESTLQTVVQKTAAVMSVLRSHLETQSSSGSWPL